MTRTHFLTDAYHVADMILLGSHEPEMNSWYQINANNYISYVLDFLSTCFTYEFGLQIATGLTRSIDVFYNQSKSTCETSLQNGFSASKKDLVSVLRKQPATSADVSTKYLFIGSFKHSTSESSQIIFRNDSRDFIRSFTKTSSKFLNQSIPLISSGITVNNFPAVYREICEIRLVVTTLDILSRLLLDKIFKKRPSIPA